MLSVTQTHDAKYFFKKCWTSKIGSRLLNELGAQSIERDDGFSGAFSLTSYPNEPVLVYLAKASGTDSFAWPLSPRIGAAI